MAPAAKEIIQRRILFKNFLFNVRVRTPINEIISDRDYLSRILDNLISNAMKFSSPNSDVEVHVEKNSDSIGQFAAA